MTWTTISHVVWDGMSPDTLNPNQQSALLDWLHWGGQLILVGGAGTTFSTLQDSFLGPYLPADQTGDNAVLAKADLVHFSQSYPPPFIATQPDASFDPDVAPANQTRRLGEFYRMPVAVNPPPARPIFLSGLKPKSGSVGIPLDKGSQRLIGVERRVGRGRILMLAVNPTDPSLIAWPGLDTFVRRVVLRRPEESTELLAPNNGRSTPRRRAGPLNGPDLTWFRYLSRDQPDSLKVDPAKADVPSKKEGLRKSNPRPPGETLLETETPPPNVDAPVSEWVDTSTLPKLARDCLEEASGIKIPGSTFILKVMLAYIIALVPLNYLICRYLIRRRELAWVAVPLLSLGFAVGVERASAFDLGYNSACDEIDVLEAFGGFPKAHVSRFSSLYSTGRTRFTISYPNDPTALALPLDNGLSLRGEDVVTSAWQSFPVPALENYLVQPRSLAMMRSEQMLTLDGGISLIEENGTSRIQNNTGFKLMDAFIIEHRALNDRVETRLGTIEAGGSVPIAQVDAGAKQSASAEALHLERFLDAFKTEFENRPESRGEVRLVAWIDKPLPGQNVAPAVDRHRGFTAVVVHLKMGAAPAPDGPVYNALAPRDEPATSSPPPTTSASSNPPSD